MAWMWLKAVPWSTIIANAPTIVEGARKLLDRRGSASEVADEQASDPASLARRLRVVELRQQEMLDVIDKLANSNEQLTEAVTYLRARAVFNFRLSMALGVVLAVLVVDSILG